MVRGFAVIRNGIITHDGKKLNIFKTEEDARKEKLNMERWIVQREEIIYQIREVDLSILDGGKLMDNQVKVQGFNREAANVGN